MSTTKDIKVDDEATIATASTSISMDGTIRTTASQVLNGRKVIAENTKKSESKNKPTLLRHSSKDSELKILNASNYRAKKALSELTINKLDLKSLGLVGREKELSTLQSSFSRLRQQQSEGSPSESNTARVENELVFVQGYSGIGKSTLAKSLQKEVISSSGAYVEGKYDFTSIDKPYSGVAKVFTGLCIKIKDCSSDAIAKVTKTINDNMKEEAEMLTELLIPELSMFLDEVDDSNNVHSRGSGMGINEHERWKHAFRMLTRIFCVHFSTVVIVLDDIQWADAPSLDVVEFLISDVENPHPLMIIGCYRSNEVDENSILYNRIHTLQEKQEKFDFRITDISLHNFDVNAVNTMVMTMLSIDDESKTQDLSAICFKRTLGNPFFLIEFMKLLQAEALVDFNLGLMKWVWDVSKIEDATMSTANVADLLQARMKKLPENVQLLLQYAACLGSQFSLSTLKYVWENHALLTWKSEGADSNISCAVEVIQKENLMESCAQEEFRWVHDKVQEAALSLSDLVTPSFQFDLGVCLYEGLNSLQLEQQLFTVADLVNKGAVIERSDLSELNLQAARKAQQMAAFQSGACYVSYGMKRLPSDAWTDHRNLALNLYSLGAEMNMALGRITVAKSCIEVVLDQKDYTPFETIHLRMTRFEIISNIESHCSDGVDYGIKLLNKIGYKFIWWRKLVPLQALLSVLKTIKRLEKLPVHYFESTEFIKDPKPIAIINLLRKVSEAAYQSEDLMMNFLCVCKVVELTLEHGLHHIMPGNITSLAAFAMILKNDHDTANHLCDIAFAIQRRCGRRGAAETIFLSVAHTLGFTKPLHESLPLCMDGYSQGMRDGNNFYGIWNLLYYYVILPHIMGRPLGQMAEDCQRIRAQLEEKNLETHTYFLRAYWQMILNLRMSPSESSKKLEGELFSPSSETTKEASFQTGIMNYCSGDLLLFFGDHEARIKRLMGEEKGKTYFDLLPGSCVGKTDSFHRGIAWFSMARKNKGKRKYRSKALKIKSLVTKWAKAGDPNVQHYDRMLCAENAALEKKYDLADRFYKDAISRAARTGCLHHAALFNERFAEYQSEVHKDEENSKFYMKQAIKYYTEWGADGKAEELSKKLV